MSLFDGMIQPNKVRTCKVATVSAELDPKDAAKLQELVMDEAWPGKTLSRELNKRGVHISETPIYAHRSKACSCWKI